MYRSLTFLPHSNFAVFDGWYFLQYCMQRAENCTNCSTSSALSTFAFSSYMWPRLQWVKSYANEEKCKQWRQQRFLRDNVPQRGLLNKVLYIIITIIFDRKGTPFIYMLIDKWYSFHIPSLEHWTPFDCYKCTAFKIRVNKKNGNFSTFS